MRSRIVRRALGALLALTVAGWPVAADAVPSSDILAFGGAVDHGPAADSEVNAPTVGIAPSATGNGYWLVAADGGIFTYGDAPFFGSTGDRRLPAPVVAMAARPTGQGYWLFASDGRVYPFGDAPFLGDLSALRLNRPIINGYSTPTGEGYWLLASDGGIFALGDAVFFGSTGDLRLSAPIVGMAPHPGGAGYWLVGRDGAVYAFGGAPYLGNALGRVRTAVVGIAATPSGQGYWIGTADGAVIGFGDAPPLAGAEAPQCLVQPVVGLAARPQHDGVWLATAPIPPAATAGRAPVDQVAVESAHIAATLRARQGCQAPVAASAAGLAHPLPGARVTEPFGSRVHPIYRVPQVHTGTDLAGPTTIRAAAAGTVVSVSSRVGYGLTTVIDHGGQIATVYAHQQSVSVREGQQVTAGQPIGVVGRTGFATGPHLHYEVRVFGDPIDAAPLLR